MAEEGMTPSGRKEPDDFDVESRRVPAGGDKSIAAAALDRQEERAIYEWLTEFNAGQPGVRVILDRREPDFHDGVKVRGHVITLEEPIDETTIAQRWGGGKYLLKVMKQTPNGGFKFVKSRIVEIAGDPLVPRKTGESLAAKPNEDTSTVKSAMSMTERLLESAERRAEKLEGELRRDTRQPGYDVGLISAITEPLKQMAAQAQQDALETRRELARVTSESRKGDPVQERMLEKLVDQDSARVAAIRATHDAELRMVREHHMAEIGRLESRFDRLLESAKDGHKREMDAINRASDNATSTLKLAYETQIKTLENQLGGLRSDLDAAKKEIVELRVKKDVPLEETMMRMFQMREMFENFAGGKEEPGWRAIADVVMNNPITQGVAKRIAGDQQPQQPQQAPTRKAVAQRVAQRKRPQGEQVAAGEATTPAELPAAPQGIPGVSEAELYLAVNFIESAINNNADPRTFAASAAAQLPPGVRGVLRKEGVEGLLQRAQINESSVINTMHGQSWLKLVVDTLIGAPGGTN